MKHPTFLKDVAITESKPKCDNPEGLCPEYPKCKLPVYFGPGHDKIMGYEDCPFNSAR